MVMTGRSYFLQEKAEAFAGRIIKMYQYLTSLKHEHVMSKQVLRSGTSIGANIAESKDAKVRQITSINLISPLKRPTKPVIG